MGELIIVALIVAIMFFGLAVTYANLFCPEIREKARKNIRERMIRLFPHIFK